MTTHTDLKCAFENLEANTCEAQVEMYSNGRVNVYCNGNFVAMAIYGKPVDCTRWYGDFELLPSELWPQVRRAIVRLADELAV